MPNNLNIIERTLANASEAKNYINRLSANGRSSANQPLVIRITDHAHNDVAETDDPDKMALFVSIRHGEPWKKMGNVLVHKVIKADADPADNPTDDEVSVLFPNYDYSTFE